MFSALKWCVFSILCTFLLVNSVQGHKILVIVPMHGKSHWNYMKVFIHELIERGHELTCITNIPMGKDKPANYTEILIDPPYKIENVGKLNQLNMFIFRTQICIVKAITSLSN